MNCTAEKGSGRRVTVEATEDEEYEALYVAGEIERLTNEDSARLGDVAIMYRTNAQSRALEDAFNRAGIRYRIIGGLRFWERREVKDVVAYLRVLHNPYDNISLLRIVNTADTRHRQAVAGHPPAVGGRRRLAAL